MVIGRSGHTTTSIESHEDFEGLTRIGQIVAEVLRTLREAVRPGITTAELNAIAARELAVRDAESSPALVYGFPGACCISVNDEVVHGVPGSRAVRAGGIVKLDLTAEKDAMSPTLPPAWRCRRWTRPQRGWPAAPSAPFARPCASPVPATKSPPSAPLSSARCAAAASTWCASSADTVWAAPFMNRRRYRTITRKGPILLTA